MSREIDSAKRAWELQGQLDLARKRTAALETERDTLAAQVEHLTQERDETLALMVAADRERDEARATITRLNRRCQLAEAAVNTKVEDFEKRSTKGLRNYYFQMGRDAARAELREAAARQRGSGAAVSDADQGPGMVDASGIGTPNKLPESSDPGQPLSIHTDHEPGYGHGV